ncbi:Os03g0439650 [Oryza sativa Japonica Group]|uniref:Os03g0439650 protein n=1 Tax=Oryza sativa subsp. japonica TaxID=39947 RepID=A0A0P0VZ84_ORYSJ|nr:hypothetical protein EE612_018330 [Oryza sativa]BAS84864.1 Os03g0439650 [Oryza sativa Japonica Group]
MAMLCCLSLKAPTKASWSTPRSVAMMLAILIASFVISAEYLSKPERRWVCRPHFRVSLLDWLRKEDHALRPVQLT